MCRQNVLFGEACMIEGLQMGDVVVVDAGTELGKDDKALVQVDGALLVTTSSHLKTTGKTIGKVIKTISY